MRRRAARTSPVRAPCGLEARLAEGGRAFVLNQFQEQERRYHYSPPGIIGIHPALIRATSDRESPMTKSKRRFVGAAAALAAVAAVAAGIATPMSTACAAGPKISFSEDILPI